MKKMLLSSLFAMLLLVVCQNEMVYAQKKAASAKTDAPTLYEFKNLESRPTYPGGVEQFYKTVFNAVKYPEDAQKNKVQGIVLLSFVIEKDGSLGEITVERKLGSGTDEAAIAALKSTVKWGPGKVEGKPVRVKMNMPIKFSLKS